MYISGGPEVPQVRKADPALSIAKGEVWNPVKLASATVGCGVSFKE
jgi:hypothetical protein